MKKRIKIITLIAIIMILFTANVYAYSTKDFSISIPKDYTETKDGFFETADGDNIGIQTTEYTKGLFEFNESNLKIMSNTILDSLKKKLSTYTDEKIEINELKKEIINITPNNYKAFHIVYKSHINGVTLYTDAYMLGYNKTLLIISINSDKNTLNNSEIKNMIETLKINNYKEAVSQYDYEFDFAVLAINFAITIFGYCLVPTILRLTKGKMEYKKGHKIIIINNIIVWILFSIISFINLGTVTNSGAVLLYYFVNKAILLKKKTESQDNIQTDNKEQDNKIEENKIEKKEIINNENQEKENTDKNDKHVENTKEIVKKEEEIMAVKKDDEPKINKTVRYCTQCGKEIDDSWTFCNYCGNKLK